MFDLWRSLEEDRMLAGEKVKNRASVWNVGALTSAERGHSVLCVCACLCVCSCWTSTNMASFLPLSPYSFMNLNGKFGSSRKWLKHSLKMHWSFWSFASLSLADADTVWESKVWLTPRSSPMFFSTTSDWVVTRKTYKVVGYFSTRYKWFLTQPQCVIVPCIQNVSYWVILWQKCVEF